MKRMKKSTGRKFNLSPVILTIIILISLTGWSCIDNSIAPQHKLPNVNTGLTRSDTTALDFFVLSDWGFSGSDTQRSVASEMGRVSKLVGLNFILTCGDNFQTAGVDSVNDPLWFDNYENVYNDSSLQVPWHPALGNHDYMGNPDAQVDYSINSKTWKMPARYYSFVEKANTRNAVRFIVLDTQGLIQDYQNLTDTTAYDSIPQYHWLKHLLSGVKEQWIIVTGHHPVFSASNHHGDTYEMKKLIKPLFDQYLVDFYICGHDHHFEHATATGKKTDYIVTGTGGSPRPEDKNERTVYSMSAPGFTYISIKKDRADLYFITVDDLIGYSYTKFAGLHSRERINHLLQN